MADRPLWEYSLEARAEEAQSLIEEYELLKGSDIPTAIAIRMGYAKPTSLARRFSRYGRHDLARGLWSKKKEEAA